MIWGNVAGVHWLTMSQLGTAVRLYLRPIIPLLGGLCTAVAMTF